VVVQGLGAAEAVAAYTALVGASGFGDGEAWIEGAVGTAGDGAGLGCHCWNSRMGRKRRAKRRWRVGEVIVWKRRS